MSAQPETTSAPSTARGGVARASVTLILSSFASSAIGLGYWLVVAHQLTKEQVGLDSAVVNTVTLITTLGSLDLINAVPRLLPAAGSRAARFITTAYLVAIGLALLITAVFLLGIRTWTPSIDYLLSDPTWTICFVVSVIVWSVFVLQDCVLIGFQRSQWIPLENISFAVAKLVCLIVLLDVAPRYAVLMSWTIPAIVFVVLVNVRLVRPIVIHEMADRPSTLPPTKSIVRSVIVGNSANIVGIVVGGSLPLLVTERLGPEANASYYLAWTMAYVLFLAPRYVSLVVLSRAEHDPESFDDLSVDATLAAVTVVGVSVAVAVVAAAPLLGLVGSDYEGATVSLLRVMCLAAIPHCLCVMAGAWARGRGRLRIAIGITTVEYLMVAGLVVALVEPFGVMGIGWAWFIAESAIAIGVLVAGRRAGVLSRERLTSSLRRGASLLSSLINAERQRVEHPTLDEHDEERTSA